MARFDVTSRLAEGRSAAEHTQSYVSASHVLGYHHPELTLHGEQVRELYDSEEGLDLRALDDDAAELRAAAHATDEALSRQRALLADLASAWRGPGAESAAEFLQRHCGAGETVAAAVRITAERWAALPDELWQLVDRKVATAITIDDRRSADRPAWLAAAQAVMSGGTGDAAAAHIVNQQVMPYVDNDIAREWLSVMRSTSLAFDAALDAVIDAAAATTAVRFELPGDLAAALPPLREPLVPIGAAVTAPAAVVSAAATTPPGPAHSPVEAAASSGPSGSAAPTAPPPAAPADATGALPPAAPADATGALPPAAPADATGALPPAAPLWDSGLGSGTGMPTGGGGSGGLGGLAASISSVIGSIVDGIGGLLGSLSDGLADSPIDDDAELEGSDADHSDGETVADGSDDQAQQPDDHPDDAQPVPVVDDAQPENPPAADQVADEPTADQPAAPVDAVPTPDPPPAESAPPPPDPDTDGATPCEIAADALPQAGE